MSTSLASLSTNFFPSAQNGFSTTLASTISSGATTVPLNSVSGYANGEIAVFVVDPSDATKKQTFTGVIDTSGIQVTSVVWTAGTNQVHTGGSTVVDYATATHISMMTKGILRTLGQDGLLKANIVAASNLATNAITLGYAQITLGVSTTSSSDTQATGLTTTVTIPAGARKVKITAFTNALSNATAAISAMTIWDGPVGIGGSTQLSQANMNSNIAVGVTAMAVVTPSAGSKTYNVGFFTSGGTLTLNASTVSPAFILVEAI